MSILLYNNNPVLNFKVAKNNNFSIPWRRNRKSKILRENYKPCLSALRTFNYNKNKFSLKFPVFLSYKGQISRWKSILKLKYRQVQVSLILLYK